MSRIENSARNIMASLGGQLLNNLLRLICRTAFIYTLGKEFLGISSLYANILTILSVSELGFSSAITYSLYKPLAENDIPTICALMHFFRNAYRVIGVIVFVVGLAVVPFLPFFMNGTTDSVNIYLYYFLYLAETVISYLFFAYKGTLLVADQKKYLNDVITYMVQITMNMIQIGVLFLLRSFFVYTVVGIVSTAVQNILISAAVDKKYPYLKGAHPKLGKEARKQVFSQVYAMSLYRISTTISSATDNLIISSQISVLMVGLYDNYYMIIQVIQKLLQGFFRAFTSSVGNFYATETKERNAFMFRCLNLMNSGIIVFCSVSFLVLLQPFVSLWIGEEYLLTYPVVVAIVMNFATNYMQSAVQTYKDASGLFVRGKYRAVATAVLNLVISIVLVRTIGLAGVFWGSVISRMVTTWWYDAWLIHRAGFGCAPAQYYAGCAVLMGLIFSLSWLIQWTTSLVPMSLVVTILLRGVMSIVLVGAAFLLLYGRSDEWKYLVDQNKTLLQNKILKKRREKQ